MPFIIFTSRANNKPSRLFHIPHPVGPPSRHVVAVVLAFPVVFVVLWLIIIICAFYISVFYCSTFLIHTQIHTYTHTETQWHTHWETVHFHWLHWVQQVAYATSATSFVAADSCWMRELSSHPFPLYCVRHPWFIYIRHILPSSHAPSLPSPVTNLRFKILSSAAHLVARLTSR